jgi:hypothetical protein
VEAQSKSLVLTDGTLGRRTPAEMVPSLRISSFVLRWAQVCPMILTRYLCRRRIRFAESQYMGSVASVDSDPPLVTLTLGTLAVRHIKRRGRVHETEASSRPHTWTCLSRNVLRQLCTKFGVDLARGHGCPGATSRSLPDRAGFGVDTKPQAASVRALHNGSGSCPD